jgi:DNA-binding Lrp family transcriptional regulator
MAQVTSRYDGKTEGDRLREGERILSDKINGTPISQIMEKYGLSKATVYRRIDQATEARIAPTVDAYREQMNAAYDEQVVRANQNIEGCLRLIEIVTAGADVAAVERALAAHARAIELLNRTREAQRKLNGLDMPARAEVSVVHHDAKDLELAEMVRQAKSRDHAPA